MPKAKKEVKEAKEVKFTKDKLLKAAVFYNRKDVLGVVVDDGEEITIAEAAERIEKFMKGQVK